MLTFHHEDPSMAMYPFIIFVVIVIILLFCFFLTIYYISKCIHNSMRYSFGYRSPPVVVTTTAVPVPPSANYPQNTVIQTHYPMPQPPPGYPPQPQPAMYPYQNQPAVQSYPMPQANVEHNPPSYDQVVRSGEAYQKQAPYNPNYTAQQ